MKRTILITIITITVLGAAISLLHSRAVEPARAGTFEYVTVRWGGRDNTHVIRPNGEVEFVGSQLRNYKRPDRADDRSFYMNVVVNGLARQGWEVSAMTPDDIIMRRPTGK
jgi:hypothetical protein